MEATKKEQDSIDSLEKLAKKWPKSIWLFCDGLSMKVMRCGKDGERVMKEKFGGVDPDYILTTVDIPHDGGDW